MTLSKVIEERVLKAKWDDGSETLISQSFRQIDPAATADQMGAFFQAIGTLSLDTLSFKGYEDSYSIQEA